MPITLPYVFKNGENADATQVDANFAALAAAIEGVSAAAAGTDVYQAGVLASTDWVPSSYVINEGTGVIEVTYPSSAAWLPGPVSGLVRTFTPGGTTKGLKPPLLPGPGGYVRVGEEITASGGEAVVSVVSGTEQASQALAIANPPAVSAGKVRVRDIVVVNTAGKYTVVAGRDRRPWALGVNSRRTLASVVMPELGATVTGLTQRIECSGRPVQATYTSEPATGAGALASVKLMLDGVMVEDLWIDATHAGGEPVFIPTAGSRLITIETTVLSGTGTKTLHGQVLQLTELLAFTSNGSS